MQKLLNNPWVVAGIVLAAVLFVSRNLVIPINIVEDDVQDDEAWMDVDGATAEEQLIGIETLRSVDSADIVWQEVPRRDPFSPDIRLKTESSASIKRQVIAQTADSVRRPKLSALIAGERTLYAVLDGQIVRPGDDIRGFRVQGITHLGVTLLKNGHRMTITSEE